MKANEKSLEFIKQIEDVVAETGQLLPAFELAYKAGNIEAFRTFINENKLQDTFVQNSFDDWVKFSDKNVSQCFYEVVVQEGLDYLGKTYGEKFAQKLEKVYEGKDISLYDVYAISNINQKENSKSQADIMEQILDLYSKDFEIGIHRTGGACSGETINKEGLNLTGNLSSGVINAEYMEIKDQLEDNISFDYFPGELLSQIAGGGSYKNLLGKKMVDIPIIAIPKDELKQNNPEIILKSKQNIHPKLNPKYRKGYVTVDSENSTMEKYVENPLCFENIFNQTIEDSKVAVKFSKIQQIIGKIKDKFRLNNKPKEEKSK